MGNIAVSPWVMSLVEINEKMTLILSIGEFSNNRLLDKMSTLHVILLCFMLEVDFLWFSEKCRGWPGGRILHCLLSTAVK